MLSASELLSQIREVESEHIQFGDFEEWFRAHSKDAHLWGDANVNSAVWAVEDVLTQYHFEGLRADGLKRELANAIRPFAVV